MSWPIFLIAAGTVFIGGGGLMATYGWVAFTEERQKAAMVKGLAAEWLLNSVVISDPPLAEPDATKLSKFVIFPRMKMAALEGAISSGSDIRRR